MDLFNSVADLQPVRNEEDKQRTARFMLYFLNCKLVTGSNGGATKLKEIFDSFVIQEQYLADQTRQEIKDK
ncbi:MAG: hypothetical protein ACOVKJ_06615 [Flavobacterium sp.]|jgi:hypothetical protein